MANISPTLQASSAVRKSGISITLPRNFAPLSLDAIGSQPRTPDQTFAEINLPPPPPHSTYRIRRPRLGIDNFSARNNALPALLFASDIPAPSSPVRHRPEFSLPVTAFSSDDMLPSIETPTGRPLLSRGLSEPMNADRLEVPFSYEPPKTPPAQTNIISTESKESRWAMQREASVCSVQSDSSLSSNETYATRPTSFDGSASSPDRDNQDPFSPQLVKVIPDTPTRRSKKLRMHSAYDKDSTQWSIEMDNHLFNVYQMYLADPTVTPFKTVPGSIPPTGVCHRVARRAKETWPKASRIEVPIVKRYRVRSLLDIRRNTRDKTPELNDFLKTDNSVASHDARKSWPTESSTRRRLKHLCRDKFTITAHYQRLRESRSPSPFAEQFARRPSSRLSRSVSQTFEDPDQPLSYATRELGISLVANDATAPLARVVGTDTSIMDQPSESWFNTPINPSSEMELSTPSAPSMEPDRLVPAAAKIPRLASPFNYSTWGGPSSKNPHRRHISHGQYDTIHATGSRLLSPFRPENDAAINMNKRRAQRDLEHELSPRGSNLSVNTNSMNLDEVMSIPPFQPKSEDQELVFTGAGDISQRRIRIRNRGATLGSAAPLSGQERIERLFAPAPMQSSDIPPVPQLPSFVTAGFGNPPPSLAVPEVDPNHRRLGSPFELDPNKRSLRNRSPRHIPSLSDPFISVDHFGINDVINSNISGISNTANNNNIGNMNERLALFGDLQDIQHPNYQP